jgi:hypothetical protein
MSSNDSKPTQEDIQKIVKENNITIPAYILYTFLQFTELGVQRGAVKANELTLIGNIYDSGTQILNQLITQKIQEKQPSTTPINNLKYKSKNK